VLERIAAAVVRERLRDAPAVVVVGPRQCGKTTLARALAGAYFDLEQESERLRLDLSWPEIAAAHELVVLDEVQAWPDVFARLRGAIDADRDRTGRFLLLGSVAPSLMTQVSESLAGRLSIVELAPFVLGELPSQAARERLWLCGGYPEGGVLKPRRFPQWQRDFLQLLIQRDLPSWGLPAKPAVTQRLARMIAAVHGQTWNASRIGQSLGLNYQTVGSYMDYFEGAFLVRRLEPFHANIKKRLVKSPKVYWRDSGLLHALLNVETRDQLLSQPWVGASWEGFVIGQTIDTLHMMGARFDAFYFRTSDGHEIDLLLERGGELLAIEVKLTTSPGPGDMARLDKAADLVGAHRRFLVSQTPRVVEGEHAVSCDLPWLLQHLADR
jgi:predicted AAA+ superfamily ATPase